MSSLINPFTYVRTRRRTISLFALVGRSVLDFLAACGECGRLLVQVWRVRPWPLTWIPGAHGTPIRRDTLIVQLYHLGFLSLPVVVVTGMSMGMVLAVQTYGTLHRFGADVMCGPMITYSMISQIGPSMTALLVAGRAGSNIAAELGTMKVTEQIDALRVMGTDPVGYLVAPRVVAITVLMPVLGALAAIVGVYAGAFLCIDVWHVDAGGYWFQAKKFLHPWDTLMGMAKCPFFGCIIGLIACRQGMRTLGGATGVGESCTRAVVQSSLMVLVLNFLLTLISNELWHLLFD